MMTQIDNPYGPSHLKKRKSGRYIAVLVNSESQILPELLFWGWLVFLVQALVLQLGNISLVRCCPLNFALCEILPFHCSIWSLLKRTLNICPLNHFYIPSQMHVLKGRITVAFLHFEQSQSFLDQASGTLANYNSLLNRIHQK